jgi:hypothetical protein
VMARYRCACGNPKLSTMSSCFVCEKWERRLQSGSAPEHKRAPAPVPGTKGEGADGGPGASSDGKSSSLAGARRRHPTDKRHLRAIDAFCRLHGYPDVWTCPRCLENSERDREEREEA